MKRRRLILSVALAAVAAAVAVSLPLVYRMAQIASAFSAETACSALFVSRRTDPATLAENLLAYGSVPLDFAVIEADRIVRLGHSVPRGGWDQPGFDALILEAMGS